VLHEIRSEYAQIMVVSKNIQHLSENSCSIASVADRRRQLACYCFEIAGLPRRTYFWTFPVAVFGSSDTNWIRWGHLKCAR
jgi:hypothetical protein